MMQSCSWKHSKMLRTCETAAAGHPVKQIVTTAREAGQLQGPRRNGSENANDRLKGCDTNLNLTKTIDALRS